MKITAAITAYTARWFYRHRTVFWPVIILVAVVSLVSLHKSYAGWWPASVVLSVILSLSLIVSSGNRLSILVKFWKYVGIDRPAERKYLATVIFFTGLWYAAALKTNDANPLPKIGFGLFIVLSIPWWFHRRRRSKVRAEKVISGWPEVSENIGLGKSKIRSLRTDNWGWTVRVKMRSGMTFSSALKLLPKIESALGIRPHSARLIKDPNFANQFFIRVIEKDPHEKDLPWPGQRITSVSGPVNIGIFEDGTPVNVQFLYRNTLIGGLIGSGKSGIVNLVIGSLAGLPDCEIWGIDLKGGMELTPWKNSMANFATDIRAAEILLLEAVKELEKRAALMTSEGKRLWEPSKSRPAIFIVIDEYSELTGKAHEYANTIAQRGRAVAVSLIAATQRPSQKAMGNNAVRSQMDNRISLRVRERRDVDLILGQGSSATGWNSHELVNPGEFLIMTPQYTSPMKAKAFRMREKQVAALSAKSKVDHVSPSHDLLLKLLEDSGEEGMTVSELTGQTGMSRPTLYRRLKNYKEEGKIAQKARGTWKIS